MKTSRTKPEIPATARVGLAELREKLGHYVRHVAYRQRQLLICDNGTPLARLLPVGQLPAADADWCSREVGQDVSQCHQARKNARKKGGEV